MRDRRRAVFKDGGFWRVCAGFACLMLSSYATNIAVFPLFDGVFTFARDISQTVQAAVLVLVGVLGMVRPRALRLRWAPACIVAMGIIGAPLLVVSISIGHAALLVLSSSMFAVVRACAMLAVGLAAARILSGRDVAVAVSLAFSIAIAGQVVCWVVPTYVGLALYFMLPFVILALSCKDALYMGKLAMAGEPPEDIAVTRPGSFLPLASQAFVAIFMFRAAFGYSLRFGEDGGTPVALFSMIVPVALAVVLFVFWKKFDADVLTQVAAICVICGLMLVNSSNATIRDTSNVLMSSGDALFYIVMWTVLVSVGSRNPVGALAAIGWGAGVGAFGTLFGAALGMIGNELSRNSADALMVASGSMVALFAGYVLIGLRKFSFKEAIEGIVPADLGAKAKTAEDLLTTRCAAIAERCRLTPRETEVFGMLARGRNREYIQDKLVVSRSTVKTHVRHVYEKLGIHSHQELIDLVENGLGD